MKILEPFRKCSHCNSLSKCLFKNLDAGALFEIEKIKRINLYRKGSILFSQDSPALGLYVIAKGKLKVSTIDYEGREHISYLATVGDIFGHHDIFIEGTHRYSTTTLEDSMVCFIDKISVQKILELNPRLFQNIFERFNFELDGLRAHEQSVISKKAKARVAELLVQLAKQEIENKHEKIKIAANLTRVEMASMVGIASETLIRLLSEFKNEGIIEISGKSLTILDEKKLLTFA